MGTCLTIYNHFLGPHNANHMASVAEKKLLVVSYYGEKKKWNFERYSTEHKKQHNVLHGLVKHGHIEIGLHSKV